ncbi:Down-regulated-in-metastasis protein [Macleaya cordata]|uniref:Down-regulated-in-metastasis protein n=1 Tax=Macleaya cordata TaxID=56857 RepID=A0A200Q4P0_MACCD|nr:Down-regulated-in-metastasis protein [Macleaya cordata]
MATVSQSMAVKSLNKSPGRKRFTFKNFSQRIEEIEIDVYRNLESLKSEPSDGSSFLKDCLIQWRELNTAEDFISFYEEMMPWVQTLPQVLLHKETIMSKLISRLQFKARLSLEPILRLIAALSRDLLEDFLPFLQRIADSLFHLLESGAEREPEVVEQIFTSWSYIMMYLRKYLTQDIIHVLKITIHLRYYSKDYVQEFMAESVSFLLRNAPLKQLIKGIRKITSEVVKKPSDVRKSGVSALLWHVMRGTSSRFHSRAEQVLRLLLDSSIIGIGDKFNQGNSFAGSDTVAEVVSAAFERLCEELPPKELNLMWSCLVDEISGCVGNDGLLHLSRLLSVLISTVRFSNGGKISDYQPMLDLVMLLIQKVIIPLGSVNAENHYCEVFDRVLQLMLCLLDGLNSSDGSAMTSISLQWAPVFELQNKSLVTFIRELLQKDPCITYAFRHHIISAINDMVKSSPSSSEEVIYLMLTFFEKLGVGKQSSNCLDGESEEKVSRMFSFLRESICYWIAVINDISHGDPSCMHLDQSKLSLIWGTITCYPHVLGAQGNTSLIMDLVDALDRLLMINADKIAGVSKHNWQSLVGAALVSYLKLQPCEKSGLAETSKFLHLAKKHKSSPQLLFAVAEFLDYTHGSTSQADSSHKIFHPEFEADKAINTINVFADNLCLPNKLIRISTLRILSHYEPLDCQLSASHQPAENKLKTEACQPCYENMDCSNVIPLLLSIEVTPLSVSTSRKVIILISRIQMALSAGRISEAYVPLLLNGIIGIFHKRFGHLWEPAIQCLTVLIDKYVVLVWEGFVRYLEQCQMEFLTPDNQLERVNVEPASKSSDLVESFSSFVSPDSDGTPCTTVLSLLLQSLQKVQAIAESRSRQLIPLFLKFLGYDGDDIARVGSFKSHACKGKEWRGVLKEWLNLLKLMKNPKSLYRSQVLKEVLINRLLDENDADIQMNVLDCLVNWKFDFLLPYEQHLKNLITSKNLREELATWSLSKESHHIQEVHRGYLIPIVVRLLIPKVRKLKTLASRKHASVHHRRAVLGFLGQLDVGELPLFFALLIKPLLPISNDWFWSACESSIEEFQASSVVKYLTVDEIGDISWKKRYGFLHVSEDIFKSFDEVHIKPFLNLLMGFVVLLLETCTLRLDSAKNNEASQVENLSSNDLTVQETLRENPIMTNTAIKQYKDLRSLCLKIVSFVLNKYEDHDFGCDFWDMFFMSVKALIDGFKQEGSSSEKPSSLFSCFLAMSRSPTLVSLLHREESLVPSIFSVLTVKTASNAIISSVLSFTENLLNQDNDLDNREDLAVKRIILPNLDTLIYSLHSLFQCHKEKQRKWPGKTELRIFKLLSKYIVEPLAAKQFVDILLPFLGNKSKNSDECLEVLHIIKGVLPKLGSETTGKILKAVAPLLISAGLDIRLCICDILNGLAVNDPSVAFLAKLVRELNAISVSEMDELDYDTRINAYESINPEFFSTIGEDHALVILSHCVHDLASDELILRQSAHRLLLTFVHFSALILGCGSKNCQEMPEPRVELEADACWTKACVQRIIKKFILKHMGEAMSKEISIQREWVALLREMVLRLSEIPSLNSIRDLCSEDAEVDFFNNILHLQKHRRARALARFRNAIGAGDFSEVITKKIFVPLFFKMLFDVQAGKGEHIRNACLESLAAISGHMQWESYHSFLLRCFREMTLKPDKYKVLLRLICSVLDRFHFSGISLSQEPKDNVSEVSRPGIVELSSSSTLHRCTASGDPTEIQVSLQKTVLPKIQKLLTADSDKVDVTISLAALKLLKLLPIDTMESQLPSIIHRISNFLKNRLESIRDEARLALAACSKELGLEYLQFLVKVMRATLKRGYELHVLGYTLNFILSKALSKPVIGKLDYCLEELLSVAENDILGDVAEEKEVEKIASKMKETRKRKSFETLKLIAQSVTFKTHAFKLLSPVKAHLQKHLTPRKKAKLETMLNHIAAGIECNPSVDQTDLFVFVYGLIEDGITEEAPQGKDLSIANPSKQFSNGTTNKRDAIRRLIGYESQSSHLITVFALGVLHNRLKNMKLDKKDESLLSMLDPFVKLLGNCLSSKYEDILSSALRCLAPLVRLPLPSLESQADKIKTLLLDIAQKSGTRNSPLMQSCLRLLTVLLRSTRIILSNDQLHMLIQFPLFVDLERNPSFIALSLLKAIVSRTLVVPEIYDIVTRVGELMVTSQIEPIRKKCSQILLQFLLDYRLTDKRLQQHLDFLLANLSYEHSSGREAVLEMLHAIIIKFPQSIVDAQAETFFLHLVVCLANDQDNKVRSMVGSAIKLLIGRTSQRSLRRNLEYTLSWYVGENQNLWSAAAQVLGLLVEVLKKGFQSHINIVLPVVKSIMKSALDVVSNKLPDPSNEATIPFWKETYYSLVMMEKILYQFPELYLEKDLEEIWEAICEFLLHPHMWIRNISNRLIASYFAATSQAKREKSEKLEVGTLLLMKPSRLFAIAVSLCCQLKAPLTDDAACKVLTQNLVFAISGVHLLAGQRKSMDLHEFWSTLELHEQSHFLKAFQLLGSRKGRILLGCLTSSVKDSIDQADGHNLQSLLVSPLLKKMGKVALQMDDIQMKIVFNCFSMISSQIGQEGCQKHAIHILLPLYKVCEGFAGKLITDDVKQLAEEVRDRIQGILGVENFVQVYNQIRKNLKAKRDKRRNEEKVMAVVNPMRNAKRKLRIAAKHRANKKRKIMTMKMGRWGY